MIAKPILLILIVALVAVFLALAVLGYGGAGAFFAEPAFIALTIVSAVMTLVAFFTQGHVGTGEREDRSNRWVLLAFLVVGLLVAYLPAYADRKDFWTLDGGTIRWAGVALYTIGCVVRILPVFALGKRFSGLVAIQHDHKLLTTGIYSVIRHPSYLGLVLTVLGWALAFRSAVGVLLTALVIPPLLARIEAEEKLLASQFGAEYDAYRRRTARLIPGVY